MKLVIVLLIRLKRSMCEGLFPSDNYSPELLSICAETLKMSLNPQKTAPKVAGRKRTTEFLQSLAQASTPVKSRRLVVAEQLAKFEKQRKTAVDKRYRTQQKMKQMACELEECETTIAELDAKIEQLKAEHVE